MSPSPKPFVAKDFDVLSKEFPVNKAEMVKMFKYFQAIETQHSPRAGAKKVCPQCSHPSPCGTLQLLNTYRTNMTVALEGLAIEVEGKLF